MSMANPLWGVPRIHRELRRCGAVDRREVHGAEVSATTLTELEDLPEQSCCRHCIDRALHGADRFLKLLYSLVNLGHESAADRVRGHCLCDRPMERPTGDEGFPLGHGAALSDQRPRWDIRSNMHAPHSCDEDPRPSDRSPVTLGHLRQGKSGAKLG